MEFTDEIMACPFPVFGLREPYDGFHLVSCHVRLMGRPATPHEVVLTYVRSADDDDAVVAIAVASFPDGDGLVIGAGLAADDEGAFRARLTDLRVAPEPLRRHAEERDAAEAAQWQPVEVALPDNRRGNIFGTMAHHFD